MNVEEPLYFPEPQTIALRQAPRINAFFNESSQGSLLPFTFTINFTDPEFKISGTDIVWTGSEPQNLLVQVSYRRIDPTTGLTRIACFGDESPGAQEVMIPTLPGVTIPPGVDIWIDCATFLLTRTFRATLLYSNQQANEFGGTVTVTRLL